MRLFSLIKNLLVPIDVLHYFLQRMLPHWYVPKNHLFLKESQVSDLGSPGAGDAAQAGDVGEVPGLTSIQQVLEVVGQGK